MIHAVAKNMEPDHRIEFLSDSQTEKGPSTGRILGIVSVGKGEARVQIQHSDGIETFTANDLKIDRLVIPAQGQPLWILK